MKQENIQGLPRLSKKVANRLLGPAPKEGTRKKSDVVDPDDAETKPNRKKTDTTSGKLFRTLSLDKLLNVAGEKKKHNAGEKSQLPSNT